MDVPTRPTRPTTPPHSNSLPFLPVEIIGHVMICFDVRTLVEIKLVSRQWQRLATTAIDSKGIGTTRKVFESNQELIDAVKQYCGPVPEGETLYYRDREISEQIACTYGWPINKWDVSQIEDFSFVFLGDSIIDYDDDPEDEDLPPLDGVAFFNENISSWNVSKATRMNNMFCGLKKFNQNISAWDVSNVTDMSGMFCATNEFNQDLSTWNVSNVTTMLEMFFMAKKFNQDVSMWDISSVTDMEGMFGETEEFNQDLSTLDVSNVQKMEGIFLDAQEFNQDISSWEGWDLTKLERRWDESRHILLGRVGLDQTRAEMG